MSKSSQMPDGGLTPTLGSNYMMDGFEFDSDYGDGPDSARKDPELPRSSRGLAGLPDGFMGTDPGEEFDFRMVEGSEEASGLGDLGGFLDTGEPKTAARLMDLAWLEGAEQDPDRLPEGINRIDYELNDFDQTELSDADETGTIKELEQAWGVDRRTDGQNLVPNIEYPRPVTGPTSDLPGDQFRAIVASSMRKSAFGEPLKKIAQDALAFFPGDPTKSPSYEKLAKALRAVQAEHGLVGNVYIRDSAFPGILTGKWDSTIKNRCASAQYILTAPGSKLAAYENYLGKQVVTEIPWADALDHYRPTLEASGKRMASGDPRLALRLAFTQSAPKARRDATNFPTHETPTVSGKVARAEFAKAPKQERSVLARNTHLAQVKKADDRIERWVKAGLLTAGKANEIRARITDPIDMLRAAAAEIPQAKRAAYLGTGIGAKERESVVTKTAAWAEGQNVEIKKAALDKVRVALGSLVKSGGISTQDAERLLSSGLTPREMYVLANARAAEPKSAELTPSDKQAQYKGQGLNARVRDASTKKTAAWAENQNAELEQVVLDRAKGVVAGLLKSGGLTPQDAKRILNCGLGAEAMLKLATKYTTEMKVAELTPTVSESYKGTAFQPNQAEKRATDMTPILPLEVRRLLRWASVQMSEGAAGKDLDYLLAARFAVGLRKTAAEPLTQLRKKHEGLAGHMYVDASAYASPAGTEGCEKGALIHRANQLGSLLAMDRCSTCASNVDGTCQKYNKQIIASVPEKQASRYQAEMIRLANADDSERTASFFAPSYDQGEYDLQNDNLDSIEYDHTPDVDQLGGILFEGLLLDTDEE